MADTYTCTFFDARAKVIVERIVSVPTGLSASMQALRYGAERIAEREGFPLFAVPVAPNADDVRWLTFEMKPGTTIAEFLKVWPSRVSAEMWMQHYGER